MSGRRNEKNSKIVDALQESMPGEMAFMPASQLSSQSAAQAINKKESLEIMKTLLHASMSCLMFLRSLLPERCFEDQRFNTSEKSWSYQCYIRGREAFDSPINPNLLVKGHGGTVLKTLQRGRSSRADCFLNWLEKGVFPALEECYLKGLQLSIFEDASSPSNIVESYTFTFNYIQSPNRECEIDGLSISLPNSPLITVKTATYAMQMLIRRLISLCNTLPDLPESRYMTMHLFYNSDCPPNYEVPGFQKSLSDNINFPFGRDWIREKQDCGSLDSGYHDTSLRVSYLQRIPRQSPDLQTESNKIPVGMLQYTKTFPRQHDLDNDIESIIGRLDECLGEGNDPTKPSGLNYQVEPNPLLEELKSGLNGNDERVTPSRSEEIASGRKFDTELDHSHANNYSIPGSQASETKWESVSNRKCCTERSHGMGNTKPLQITEAKHQELENSKNVLMTTKDDVIKCQCDWNYEEDDMFQCTFCSTWQHLYCYGYRGLQDSRIPEIHACYECLLKGKEQPLLQEMKELVLLRKSMHLVEQEGYDNDRMFSDLLHKDLQTTSKAIKHLRREKYIIATSGSKRKGFSLSGRPKFSAVSTEPNYSRMMKKYFDPAAKIAHHFEAFHPATAEQNNIRKSIAMQVMSQIADSANVETYLRDIQSPNTPEASSLPSKSRRERSLRSDQYHCDTESNKIASLVSQRQTSLRKRSHKENINGLQTPQPSSKRLRSSKSLRYINVGELQTPSEVGRV